MEHSHLVTLQLTGPRDNQYGYWRVSICGILCAHVGEISEAMEGAKLLTNKQSHSLKECDPRSCEDFRTCKTTSLRWNLLFNNQNDCHDDSFPVNGHVNALLQTLTRLGYNLKNHSMYSGKLNRNSTWTFVVDDFVPGKFQAFAQE